MARLQDLYQLIPTTITGLEIFLVTANFTVTESQQNTAIVVQSSTEQTITLTFPDTLSIGFQCYVVNDKDNNSNTKIIIDLPSNYTSEIYNTVLVGSSTSVAHIDTGEFFLSGNMSRAFQLGAVINITGNNNLEVNNFYEVVGPATLTFPANPVEGNIIGIVDSQGTFPENPVLLNGNGKNIEGVSIFTLDKRDENIQFYYNGNRWIYISRFYYVDTHRDISDYLTGGLVAGDGIDIESIANPVTGFNSFVISSDGSGGGTGDMLKATYDTNDNGIVDNSALLGGQDSDYHLARVNHTGTQLASTISDFSTAVGVVINTIPVSVSTNYTLQASDNKKWIKASGDIIITVGSQVDYFECIIQNVGTGTITISGVTNAVGDKITEQWRACHIYYDGTAWTAVGALES
jgi:hypothetical protein